MNLTKTPTVIVNVQRPTFNSGHFHNFNPQVLHNTVAHLCYSPPLVSRSLSLSYQRIFDKRHLLGHDCKLYCCYCCWWRFFVNAIQSLLSLNLLLIYFSSLSCMIPVQMLMVQKQVCMISMLAFCSGEQQIAMNLPCSVNKNM